jgi:F-type H+-transporting ATPase subunit O
VFGVEGRCATALYSAASKQKQLHVVEKELVQFNSTLKTDVKLLYFIKNPPLKGQLKVEGLKQVATKLPLSSQSSNLLVFLAENGRLKNLERKLVYFKP